MVAQNEREYEENGLTSDFQNLIKIARWNYVGIPFIDFLLPYFCRDILSATATQIGMVISFTLLGVILSSALTGFLTKKVGSKKLMVIASIGRGCVYLIMYTSFIIGSIHLLMIAALIKGAFVGVFEVAFEVYVADKSHKTRRSFAFGKVISSKGIIFLIGGLIGFLLYGVLNYFNLYYFIQLSPMILFAASLFWTGIRIKSRIIDTIQVPLKGSDNIDKMNLETLSVDLVEVEEKHLKSKMPNGFILGIIFLFISLFFTSLNDFITHPFIQVYLLEVFDSSFVLVLLAYTPGALISLILAPQFGRLADRINPYWGIAIVSVAGAALTFWLINTTQVWMFAIIFLLDRGFALTGALLVKSFVSRLSIEKRGINLGFSWSIANIGGVIGPTVGGLLYDGFYPQMPFIISIFVEIALIFFYIIGIYTSKNYMAETLDEKE